MSFNRHAGFRAPATRGRASRGVTDRTPERPAGGLRGRLLRTGLATVMLQGASLLLSLLLAVVLARLLGADGYGRYAFAMAAVSLLAIPVQLGLPSLLVRLCAIYHRRGDHASMKGLLIRANLAVLGLGLVLGAGAAGVLLLLPGARDWVYREPLLLAVSLIPLFGLIGIRAAALRGLSRILSSQLPENLLRPLLFTALLATVWWWFGGVSVITVIGLNILATAFGFAAGWWLLWRALPEPVHTTPARFLDREWLAGALPFLLIAGLQVVMQQTDILMLGFYVPPAEVGMYRAAVQGAMLVGLSLSVVNAVIAPHVARSYDADDSQRLQWLVRSAARFAVLGAAPLALLYLLLGDRLLALVFGAGFAGAYPALVILAVGQFMNVALGCVGLILSMTGRAWYATAGVTVAASLNVLLNVLLIPRFGMQGAAWATALGLLAWNVLLAWWVYRLLGIVSSGLWFGGR